ncbi:MAG: ABC transporter ATP-binding protein [Clostridiales bacterium]|nr:ABC transporter ATP-binding protein [Clostridiales bacterium]
MKTIFAYFKNYKWQSLFGPLFKLLEATFELLVPFIVGLIVDRGLGANVDGGYPNADLGYIVGMCGVLALFGVFGFLFSVIAQYFAARAATGVSADLRRDLFRKIQSLSYKDLDTLGYSTMLTRMTSDIDKLQSGINLALRLFLRSPFIVFGAMITACIIDPNSFGIFAIAIVLLAIVVYAVMFACMPLYKKTQEKLDKVVLSTRENLTGVRVIRAFCGEEREEKLFTKRNEELTKGRKFVGAIASITNPLTYALVNFAIIVLLWTGAIRVDGGTLSQGNVIALYNLMGQILIELIKLANLIVTVTKAAACGGRVSAVLQTTPSLQTVDGAVKKADAPFILFDGVGMQYLEGAEPALKGISFTAERGQTIGVIGGTGSGKTTLVNLLPHFYNASEGGVYIDGQSVQTASLQTWLRERIAIVPQKAVLFKGTLKENLLWGDSEATDERLWEALVLARADSFVREKGGLEIPVEQGGKNFSGGQKQRLTIARALVRNPEILILDDSSSALDYATDAELRQNIRTLNTTTFIVSQRASSVMHADKIIVLDDGVAVGTGTHEELMQSCEVYREIYFSQYGEGGETV